MNEDEPLFTSFWEASSIHAFNAQEFVKQMKAYDSDDKQLFLEYPDAPTPLPPARTRLNRVAKKRHSARAFSGKEMSVKELSRLLSSFRAWNGVEHRAYPSAGATYVTEIFCVAFNVSSFTGKAMYYDPGKHATVVIRDDAPSWAEASKSLNMSIQGSPNILLVLVMFPDRAMGKYGERGGRFALLEAGAAMQQLSLQIAESPNLKGVAVGGMYDDIWPRVLGLKDTGAHIALGYLVGK